MLQSIKSILVGLTEEGDAREASSALGYSMSMARRAGAHVTVQAASLRLVLTHAFVSNFASGLVAAENKRLRTLAAAVADTARNDAAAAGVNCTTEIPHLTYPDLVRSFT